MFSIATPKFAPNTLVELREGVNFWINRKELVHYTKGHEFTVKSSHITHKYQECLDAFEEGGEIINPEFFYELIDKDGHTLMSYEDMLKRVKLESKLPPDEVDESDDDKLPESSTSTDIIRKKTQTSAKPNQSISRGFKPVIIR